MKTKDIEESTHIITDIKNEEFMHVYYDNGVIRFGDSRRNHLVMGLPFSHISDDGTVFKLTTKVVPGTMTSRVDVVDDIKIYNDVLNSPDVDLLNNIIDKEKFKNDISNRIEDIRNNKLKSIGI